MRCFTKGWTHSCSNLGKVRWPHVPRSSGRLEAQRAWRISRILWGSLCDFCYCKHRNWSAILVVRWPSRIYNRHVEHCGLLQQHVLRDMDCTKSCLNLYQICKHIEVWNILKCDLKKNIKKSVLHLRLLLYIFQRETWEGLDPYYPREEWSHFDPYLLADGMFAAGMIFR